MMQQQLMLYKAPYFRFKCRHARRLMVFRADLWMSHFVLFEMKSSSLNLSLKSTLSLHCCGFLSHAASVRWVVFSGPSRSITSLPSQSVICHAALASLHPQTHFQISQKSSLLKLRHNVSLSVKLSTKQFFNTGPFQHDLVTFLFTIPQNEDPFSVMSCH